MYVKALSTVLGKGLGFDNIDLFVLCPLNGSTYKGRFVCKKDNRGTRKGGVHLYLGS